jgi:hypothetical protein
MAEARKRIPVAFYRASSGREPVREWLQALSDENRKIIGDDLRTLEFGWPVGMPLCRSVTSHKGLWELRSGLTGNRTHDCSSALPKVVWSCCMASSRNPASRRSPI